MTRFSLMIAATGALVLAGCHHDGWRGHHEADTAKIAEDIKAKEAQWQKEYMAKNMDALAAEYESDAALAGPGDPLATSEAERRKSIQGLTSDPNLQLSFASDRILVAKSGELASSRGHYTLTMT